MLAYLLILLKYKYWQTMDNATWQTILCYLLLVKHRLFLSPLSEVLRVGRLWRGELLHTAFRLT